jgi:hypothetical protein
VLGYWSELFSNWLTQNRRCLWFVAHKTTLPGLPGVQFQNYSDNISYRRYFSIYGKEDAFFLLKIRGTSEKYKNQPRPLLRPRSVYFRQYFRNLSRKTVPLSGFLLCSGSSWLLLSLVLRKIWPPPLFSLSCLPPSPPFIIGSFFSTNSNSASIFAFYDTQARTKRLKKTKSLFCKCVLESNFTFISGLGGIVFFC